MIETMIAVSAVIVSALALIGLVSLLVLNGFPLYAVFGIMLFAGMVNECYDG